MFKTLFKLFKSIDLWAKVKNEQKRKTNNS